VRPIGLALLLAAAPAAADAPSDLAKRFETDVKVLASDDMEGRGLGTKGIEKAADWIDARLKAEGLKPAFGNSYRQPFKVKTGVALAKGNSLKGVADSDWTPLGFTSSGSFKGEAVFVGYGITAPSLGYDELANVDLKGKVAVMLRYEPQEKDDASIFDGRRPSRWSALRYKVLQARERGAAAVVFVTGPLQDEGKDKLPALANDGPESPSGIPVLQVKASVAQKWLDRAGIKLEQFQKDVDRDLKPRSQVLKGLTIAGKVNVTNTWSETSNLAGVLPGKGALADQIVVVGAHYDHLGYGGEGSMRPNVHAIHNGADDNASGDVSVLLAAEKAQALLKDATNARTLVVMLFSGEESGLAGSSYFTEHAPFPLEKIVSMVNLDMVGHLRDDTLIAMGSDSAPEWKSVLDRAAPFGNLKINAHGDGYGPSDQTAFYARHIPVIFFFTGSHDRYHTPDDKADTLDFAGTARVIEVTTRVLSELATDAQAPQYARSVTAPAFEGDSRGYGAYLGTVPDYSAMEATEGGVKLSDVRAGGPADKAGIKGGDRIIGMAGTRIENLYDMTYALQDHKPNDTIDVVVMRGAQKLTLRATLGSRSDMANIKPGQAHPGADMKMATTTVPAASAPVTPEPKAKVADYFVNRPGKDFVIKAGKPFEKTFDGEKHFRDIRQLTFGGQNAEAYWSPDGTQLIFQGYSGERKCDQQFTMNLATGETKMVSSGKGRTTCGYFRYPQQDKIIFASTELGGESCPKEPDRSHGYVWAVYPTYDIFEADPDGSHAKRLTTEKGYDAEATWCPRGGKFVFTSTRDGDLDLYEMDEAGQAKRLTNTPGYDGGAFYNSDCSQIVFRANHPTGAALDEYRTLLSQGLVRPTTMELFVMKSDGSNMKQITHNGAANFCPFFTPDSSHVIFASNKGDPQGREFDLWLVDTNGGEPERVTTSPGFDGFPMFSPDGEFVVWASNRASAPGSHETNLFVARWVN